jgi:hypothetical protein
MVARFLPLITGVALVSVAAAQERASPDQTGTVQEIKLPGGTERDLVKQPWLDAKRDPDSRARLVLNQMTLDEKSVLRAARMRCDR